MATRPATRWVDRGTNFVGPGWLQAGQLRLGDQLRTASGRDVTVVSLRYHAAKVEVYTLTLGQNHDFFASVARVLVHNTPCATWLETVAKSNLVTAPSDVEIADVVTGLKYNVPVLNYATSINTYIAGVLEQGGGKFIETRARTDALGSTEQGFRILLDELGGTWRKGYIQGTLNGRAVELHFTVNNAGRVLNVKLFSLNP
jgi:hypothetical protein